MLLEIMVATSCISQVGCQETTHAYYLQSKELQKLGTSIEKYSNELFKGNEWIVWVGTPAVTWLRGQNTKIKVSENWYIDVNAPKKYVGIQYNW